MNIGIVDISGNFVGPALGLYALGHDVAWFGCGCLVPRSLYGRGVVVTHPPIDRDLVIVAAPFSDLLVARETGRCDVQLPEVPFDWLDGQRGFAERAILVDVSDCREPIDPWFATRGRARLKRELGPEAAPDIHSFPFVYNPPLLEMEWTVGLDTVLRPLSERSGGSHIVFAGTLDHWRYDGRRRRLLAQLRRRLPGLEIRLLEGLSLGPIWQELQDARAGLYLPGRGEVCFRLHELAALGVPALAAEPWSLDVPQAWHDVLGLDLDATRTPAQMLGFYRDHYHPIHAAARLLEVSALEAATPYLLSRPPPSYRVTPTSAFDNASPAAAAESKTPIWK